MTLIEALVALTIVAASLTGAFEACRMATQRQALAAIEVEAANAAANLLNSSKESSAASHLEETEANGLRWSIDTELLRSGKDVIGTQRVASVTINRGGISTEKSLASLTLAPGVVK